ncbi:hypothetical protein NQ314_001803 [Rhamnusium bicolor]|uniref:Vanin C-terminal domain-containing protein n=1 Tax=Rhamnusium bicolor TaxID=1586634 RepID=A0AAV8ZSX7_9CUCU|nr:hypothetical protein NQ314_001803 [Rhamnusium bicolor]
MRKLLVYNGPAKFADSIRNIKLCTLVSCETSDRRTCGSRNVTLTTKFSEVSIGGDFESDKDDFYQPLTLTTDLLPIFNTSFSSIRVNETISISFNKTRTVEKIIVFGIFGRGSASAFGSSFVFLVILSVLKFLF